MTAEQRLEAPPWDIANTLRGKMSADDLLKVDSCTEPHDPKTSTPTLPL